MLAVAPALNPHTPAARCGQRDYIVDLAGEISSKKVIIALNKIDVIKKVNLLGMIKKTSELFPDAEIFPISALKSEGVDELFDSVLKRMPAGPKLYPDDIISTKPERFFVSEIIRESIFLSVKEEIPYSFLSIIPTLHYSSPPFIGSQIGN